MLGTEGVRLPNPTDGSPGMLKLELAKSKADECLLSEEIIHPSLGPALPRGAEVIEGASGSTTSLREPIGLRNVSIMLEPRGRVVLTIPEAILLRSLHLLSANPAVGEGEWLHFLELWACGPVGTSPGSLGLIPGDKGVS